MRETRLTADSPPWLSVVMPSYCGARWIGTALQSLVENDDGGLEVLVIDGSPTRDTADIAATFSDRLRLQVIRRPDLQTWQSKTNLGVETAAAQHVCWLGVDDVWFANRGAVARAWIDTAPSASLHLGPSAIIDERGATLGVWRCPLPANAQLESDFVTSRLLIQNFIAAPAPIFLRDAWLECGGLDDALWYAADWDMWLKLAAAGSVYYHPEVSIGFRIHRDSLTTTGSRNAADFAEQLDTVLKRHLVRSPAGSMPIEEAARASIAINVALAMAHAGDYAALPRAFLGLVKLGPRGIRRYIRDSRILDRAVPRLRATRLNGF